MRDAHLLLAQTTRHPNGQTPQASPEEEQASRRRRRSEKQARQRRESQHHQQKEHQARDEQQRRQRCSCDARAGRRRLPPRREREQRGRRRRGRSWRRGGGWWRSPGKQGPSMRSAKRGAGEEQTHGNTATRTSTATTNTASAARIPRRDVAYDWLPSRTTRLACLLPEGRETAATRKRASCSTLARSARRGSCHESQLRLTCASHERSR